ncbi:MAG: tetratricopeptide repeat protein [Granulosicoccus sp.]
MPGLAHKQAVVSLLLWCFSCLISADQTDQRLESLFEQLRSAKDSAVAQQIESRIWQIWFEAPDANAQLLVSQIDQAVAARRLQIGLQLADQLVDSNPDYAEAWNKRATINYLMGDNDQSVADIRKTLELEPRHFGAISGLGLIFIRQGNIRAAQDAFEQVLNISPSSASALRNIERLKQESGREI